MMSMLSLFRYGTNENLYDVLVNRLSHNGCSTRLLTNTNQKIIFEVSKVNECSTGDVCRLAIEPEKVQIHITQAQILLINSATRISNSIKFDIGFLYQNYDEHSLSLQNVIIKEIQKVADIASLMLL